MRILAIDDKGPALKLLTASIAKACPGAKVFPFAKPSELLAFAQDAHYDVAFLDVGLPGMDGFAVAAELKGRYPRINIIFVTAETNHALKAIEARASGFITKPATPEAVGRELENLRYPVVWKPANQEDNVHG